MSDKCNYSEATNKRNIDSLLRILDYFIKYERNSRYREGNLAFNPGSDFPESIKTDGKTIAKEIQEKRKLELIRLIEQRSRNRKKLSSEDRKELEEIIKTKNIVALDSILDTVSFYLPGDKSNIKEQAEQLILDDTFILCDYILEKYDKYGTLKQPGIVFTCYFGDDGEVFASKYENKALLIIMAGLLDEEIEVLEQAYAEEMQELLKELNSCVNQKDIEQIINYIDDTINAKYPKASIRWKDFSEKEGWRRTHKVFITHEAIDGTYEPIFRKEIENICKLVENRQSIPEVLNKYISPEDTAKYNPFDSIMKSSLLLHLGSYTEEYPVNFKQWSILQLVKKVKLLAVSGPPGTGKTTLLKEIAANEFVQKAVILTENWDAPWLEVMYKNNTFATIPDLEKISRHSMVVASTNNAAVDNIGNELAQEIDFCKTIVAAGLESGEQNASYTGTFCGQMGNKKNFEEKFLAYFKIFQSGLSKMEVNEEKAREIRETFVKAYRDFQTVNESFLQVVARRKKLYEGLKDTANGNGIVAKDFTSLQSTLKARLHTVSNEFDQVGEEKNIIKAKHHAINSLLEKLGAELNSLSSNAQTTEQKIPTILAEKKELYVAYETYKQRKKWGWFAALWPRWRNFFSQYPSLRYIDDSIEEHKFSLEKLQTELKEINNRASQLRTESELLREELAQLSSQLKGLDYRLNELGDSRNNLQENIKAIEQLMQNFRDALDHYIQMVAVPKYEIADLIKLAGSVEVDEKEFAGWHSLANAPYLLILRHRLFKGALDLTEQYILLNRDAILKNFELICTNGGGWFNRFYNSLEMYDSEQVACLKSLWNTIFLCFPIITCTLHSFKGSYRNFKQLIPSLIGLLLVDEAGQILPHYLCGPLFRSQRAIIVGDVAQIEPVRAKGSEIIDDERFENMDKDIIRIDLNSAQSYANRGSDYWEEMKGRREGIILEEHRRCERSIIEYSNRYVYSNKLKVFKNDNHEKLFGKNLIAIDVRGPKNGSRHVNQTEVDFCAKLMPELQKAYGNSIGVITPFRAQAEALSLTLEKQFGIAAGTVHKFQGQEKDCIIFSLVVDSLDKQKGLVKFIGGTANMLNVVLSRAKKQVIIIGNLTVLENAPNQLGNLYKVIKEKGRIISLFDMERYGQLESSEIEMICRCMAYTPYNLQDTIGQYVQNKFPLGIISSIAEHQELLRYVVINIKGSMVIHSPWIMSEIGPNTVVSEIERQFKLGIYVKIYYGYRKPTSPIPVEGIDNPAFLQTLLNIDYTGSAYRERARKAILKLHDILGSNLVYNAPTHVKMLIIDDRYAIVGSFNWLSWSSVTDRNEVSCIITNKEAVRYLKETMFG
ncbi:AAA domain-containing protein [Desulfosporosinus sp. SB140]|uniref:AAA domain-containing protein n=1 Tax=Desulfosporosinus paludis TaxID=3115649 RepID=UPI00388E0631